MKIELSDHAVERYQERVKPHLDLRAARAEVLALIRMAGEPVQELSWSHDGAEADRTDAYLELSDGIALPLVRSRPNRMMACTLLTRSSHDSEYRRHKNAAKAKRRAARRVARRRGERVIKR